MSWFCSSCVPLRNWLKCNPQLSGTNIIIFLKLTYIIQKCENAYRTCLQQHISFIFIIYYFFLILFLMNSANSKNEQMLEHFLQLIVLVCLQSSILNCLNLQYHIYYCMKIITIQLLVCSKQDHYFIKLTLNTILN